MNQQMGTVLVPSVSDVLLSFAGGQLSCAVLFELVFSTCPVNPEGMGSWSKSGGEKRAAQTQVHMTGEEHLSPPDSTPYTAPSLNT